MHCHTTQITEKLFTCTQIWLITALRFIHKNHYHCVCILSNLQPSTFVQNIYEPKLHFCCIFLVHAIQNIPTSEHVVSH